ncbi:MAG: biopolymer transporter ExbD [Hydrogenophaga sp.]|nr:biopolymer transporter ExbD [Hydrogenophaga sp.]MCV0438501.1 biopolymer transporter ExbD [Hydrogenophaga sp.]
MSFGRLERSAVDRPMSEINVTPLVDVMLVLLVIFIIAAPFMASRLALELPQAGAEAVAPASPEAVVSIEVNAQGQVHWDGQPVDLDVLRQHLERAARNNPATEVQLRADTSVPYGRVVQLIGLVQAIGLSRIGFVAETAPAAVR